MLGGSSSVNGMITCAASRRTTTTGPSPAALAGATGRCCPTSNAPRPTKACRTTTTAPTGYRRSAKTATATRSAWRLSRAGQGLNLPYRNDFNGGSQHGVGFYQTTTHNGERASTARTYLKAVRDEQRLVVKLNALAHRLTFEGNVATGVVHSQNGGAEVTARATKG